MPPENYSLDPILDDDWMQKRKEALYFQTVKWAELNKMEFPEARWRIKNLIPLQGLVILSAIPGGKKTWLGMEMGRSIAQGINFLETEQFPVIKGRVLYIDCESSKSEIQRRGRQLGLRDEDDFLILSKDDLNLNDGLEVNKLAMTIDEEKVDVVFIDTFRSVAGGLREEKAEEVREFFANFKNFKDKGIAVVFLDHFRKPSNFDGKVPKKEMLIGSTDKTASVEILLMLHSDSGSPEISFYQRKNRLGKEIPPFKILMADKEEDGKVLTTLKFEEEIADEVNKKEEAKELIYGLLEGSEGLGTKGILSSLQKEVGSKNIRRALGEMVQEGLVKVGKSGKQNFYSLPKGEEWLEAEGGPLFSPENNNFSGP